MSGCEEMLRAGAAPAPGVLLCPCPLSSGSACWPHSKGTRGGQLWAAWGRTCRLWALGAGGWKPRAGRRRPGAVLWSRCPPRAQCMPFSHSSQSNGSRWLSLGCRVSLWMTACLLQPLIFGLWLTPAVLLSSLSTAWERAGHPGGWLVLPGALDTVTRPPGPWQRGHSQHGLSTCSGARMLRGLPFFWGDAAAPATPPCPLLLQGSPTLCLGVPR